MAPTSGMTAYWINEEIPSDANRRAWIREICRNQQRAAQATDRAMYFRDQGQLDLAIEWQESASLNAFMARNALFCLIGGLA